MAERHAVGAQTLSAYPLRRALERRLVVGDTRGDELLPRALGVAAVGKHQDKFAAAVCYLQYAMTLRVPGGVHRHEASVAEHIVGLPAGPSEPFQSKL